MLQSGSSGITLTLAVSIQNHGFHPSSCPPPGPPSSSPALDVPDSRYPAAALGCFKTSLSSLSLNPSVRCWSLTSCLPVTVLVRGYQRPELCSLHSLIGIQSESAREGCSLGVARYEIPHCTAEPRRAPDTSEVQPVAQLFCFREIRVRLPKPLPAPPLHAWPGGLGPSVLDSLVDGFKALRGAGCWSSRAHPPA
jgi:hypothetical protein